MVAHQPNDHDASSAPHVRVWDAPTRIFHWAVVCLVATSWYSADSGLIKLHLCSGSALLTLLIFRIGWGVVGSTTARFGDFVTHPRMVFGYLKALASRTTKPLHAGHNPAGGWMVVMFLFALLLQVITGLFANNGLHFNGPLALLIGKDASDQLTQMHGLFFNLILLLIWLHLVAVFFYWLVKGENLIAPMFSGKKLAAHVPPGLKLSFARTTVALLLVMLSAAVVGWMVV